MHAGLAILSNELIYVKQVVSDARGGVIYNSNEKGSFARASSGLPAARKSYTK